MLLEVVGVPETMVDHLSLRENIPLVWLLVDMALLMPGVLKPPKPGMFSPMFDWVEDGVDTWGPLWPVLELPEVVTLLIGGLGPPCPLLPGP